MHHSEVTQTEWFILEFIFITSTFTLFKYKGAYVGERKFLECLCIPHFESFVCWDFLHETPYSELLVLRMSLVFNNNSGITFSWLILVLLLLSLAPQPSLGLGLLHKIQLNFFDASQQFYFLQGRVVSSTPNPHPGGPGLCIIYIPQRQGDYPF
jgi:hypothetical protein